MRRAATCVLTCFVLVTTAFPTYAAEDARRAMRLGAVWPDSPSTAPPGSTAFWERLRELGYVEGQNSVVDAHWAHGQVDRLPQLVSDAAARGGIRMTIR